MKIAHEVHDHLQYEHLILLGREPQSSVFPVNQFRLISFGNFLYIDRDSFDALQIFNNEIHPSLNKTGNFRKEGLSLYGILAQAATSDGRKLLKSWLKRPITDFAKLHGRQKDILYFSLDQNEEITSSLRTLLKPIKNLGPLIGRIHCNGRISMADWKTLTMTCQNMCHIKAIADSVQSSNPDLVIFTHLIKIPTEEINEMVHHLQMIDFEAFKLSGTFSIASGYDSNLDEAIERYRQLPDLLSRLARAEMEGNPSIEQCQLEYFPQVGYLVGISRDCLDEAFIEDVRTHFPGLDFQFVSDSVVHYRSEITRGLDIELGDLFGRIVDLETAHMLALQTRVLDHAETLETFSQYCIELDTLIGLAIAARDMDFTCMPVLNADGDSIKITSARHPLQELCVGGSFMPNNIHLKRGKVEAVVITGPNGSGKSIYLKQIPLLLIMAFVGCFIPAQEASICAVDRIYTRIQTR